MASKTKSEKRHLVRSPNYPAISLKEALAKARLFLDNRIGRHAVGLETVAKIWDTTLKSSGFKLHLAALRAFSLLENVPGGKEKMVRVSPVALDILVDYPEGSPGQQSAIQRAALSPAIHAEMRERYGPTLPADEEVRRYLVRERNFNDKTVGEFIEEYKVTIAFAKLEGVDKIAAGEKKKPNGSALVGDLVQWTSQGGHQFAEPYPIIGISDDGQWAFFEHSPTGIPMSELTVEKKAGARQQPPANPYQSSASLPKGSGLSNTQAGSKTTFRDLPVTLPDSLEVAVFRVPVPMSKDDFNTLVSSLTCMEHALVRKDNPQEESVRLKMLEQAARTASAQGSPPNLG